MIIVSIAICLDSGQIVPVVLKYEMGIFWRNGAKWAISGQKGAKWAIFGRNGRVEYGYA